MKRQSKLSRRCLFYYVLEIALDQFGLSINILAFCIFLSSTMNKSEDIVVEGLDFDTIEFDLKIEAIHLIHDYYRE